MEAVKSPGSPRSALDALAAPVVILVGHFGSGKSEIAVNLALGFAARGERVTLVDLDVVKPYFRCRLAKDELEAAGVHLVVPQGETFWADLPIVVPEARGAVSSASGARVIMDVGGADLGARALGSIADVVVPGRTDVLFVVNTRRPFAETQAGLRSMLAEVRAAGRLEITGLVANTHLMEESTPDVILTGFAAAQELAASTGIPIRFAAVLARLEPELQGSAVADGDCPVLAVTRHLLPPHEPRLRPAKHRPLGL